MSGVLTGSEGFLARFEAARARLPGDTAQRVAAAQAFRAAGLPGGSRGQRQPEAWKYTSLRSLAEVRFDADAPPRHEAETILGRLHLLDAPRLVFVDGTLRADLSVMPPVGVGRFAETGTLSWPSAQSAGEPMVALNTMFVTDGVAIEVPDGVDGGLLQLVSVVTRDTDVHTRHSIRLGTGARLRLLEVSVGAGSYLLNSVAAFHVAEDAVLTHIRLQDEAATAFHVSTAYAAVAAKGVYDSFSLNLGARLSRTEVHAVLQGQRGAVHLNAAQLLNDRQHADFTTVVRHQAEACASRQTVKNVLSGQSRGVFQGRIEVAREAQKTDGYQMNQALLLSAEAEVDSKPELEIFADDVKCSHGATVGELDAEQMFYLRSRGVPEAQARAILVRAFLTEALDGVADPTLRGWLDTAVEAWWERAV